MRLSARFIELFGLLTFSILSSCTTYTGERYPTLSVEDLAKQKKLDAPLAGFVEAIDGKPVQDQHAVLARGALSIDVRGWAVDMTAEKPGRVMAIRAGTRLARCEYGMERTDVAVALRNENYTYSGYNCHIATSALNSGDTILETILFTGAGSYYAGQKVVVTTTR